MHAVAEELAARVRLSLGSSAHPIYEMVAAALRKLPVKGGTLVDVGCGRGALWEHVSDLFGRYVGVDAVRYDGFPAEAELRLCDLNHVRWPLADGGADAVVSLEAIHFLENPRAFVRELTRLAKPGGWVAVTTPNQLNLTSKLYLVFKNQFHWFQEAPGCYPAHITALLEVDLIRIFTEAGLGGLAVHYTNRGRIPLTPWDWPAICRGRLFSDNFMVVGRKPETPG